MKVFRWVIFIVYFCFALVWAFGAGFNRSDLNRYDGIKSYMNITTEIIKSYLDNSGNLTICVKGYLSDSEKYRSELSSYSIQIPWKMLRENKGYSDDKVTLTYKSKVLMVSDKAIVNNECLKNTDQDHYVSLPIYNVDKENNRAINEYKYIENLDVDEDLFILTFPNYSYSLSLHPKTLDLFIVTKEPDVAGRTYYSIYLDPTMLFRNISFAEYIWAFTKDALLFPVQLFKFLGQHG